MKAHEFTSLIITAFLSTTIISIVTLEDRESFDCHDEKLENLIDTNQRKWRNYDFVMGDCLFERFIEENSIDKSDRSSIDFYSLLEKLERIVKQNLEYNKRQLEAAKRDASNELAAINKMRYDLKVKSVTRQSNRNSLILNKLLEEAKVEVSIVASQIDSTMEYCLRSNTRIANNSSEMILRDIEDNKIGEKCSSRMNDTLIMARALCKQLDAQYALQQLAYKLYQLA